MKTADYCTRVDLYSGTIYLFIAVFENVFVMYLDFLYRNVKNESDIPLTHKSDYYALLLVSHQSTGDF